MPAVCRRLVSVGAALALGLALTGPSANCAFAQDASAAGAPAGLRVFYTGHSFHMFVPAQVEQLVKSAGIPGHKLVGTQSIGGSRVIQHWDLPDEKNKAKPALATGEVDVFTMAAHVLIPDDGITKFVELGLKHNPKARFLVQASWFPFDVPDPVRRIKDNAQRDQMTIEDLKAPVMEWKDKLEKQVNDLNTQHQKQAVFIVPVGGAVLKLRELVIAGKFPGVSKQSELFTDPIGHAHAHVQAVATCCNYACIYRRSPEGLALKLNGLSDEQRAIVQKIAWEMVTSYPLSGVTAEAPAK